jgi:acyl carrier protein
MFQLVELRGETIVKLQETVFEVISQEIPLSSGMFSLETPLEDLGIDSLTAITILYELEDRLDIEISNDIFDSLKNVGDILQQLQQLTTSHDTECP